MSKLLYASFGARIVREIRFQSLVDGGASIHANFSLHNNIASGNFTFSVSQLLAGGPSNGLAFAESRFLAVIAVFGHLSQRNGVWARSRNKEHVSCNSYGTSNHWQSLRTSREKPDNRLERVKIISKQSNCLGTRRKKHKTALRRFVFLSISQCLRLVAGAGFDPAYSDELPRMLR